MKYKPEKWVWAEEDFELMDWHDCNIYAISAFPDTYELLMDIDYIFKWVAPGKGGTHFKFWVAPATLVFENAHDIVFDIETPGELTIDSINRGASSIPRNAEFIRKKLEWHWDIELHEGVISLKAAGFNMHVRSEAKLLKGQSFGRESRGGISFSRQRESS